MAKAPAKKDWSDEVISFRYEGKAYREKIKGPLILRDLSVEEIKEHLNHIPGKFAYWKSLQVHIELDLEQKKEEFDIWQAEKYQEASDKFDKKPTETAIKNRLMLDNVNEWRNRRLELINMESVTNQIAVITKAYDYQVWTLGRIAGLTAQEMNNLEPRVAGRGNLRNMD